MRGKIYNWILFRKDSFSEPPESDCLRGGAGRQQMSWNTLHNTYLLKPYSITEETRKF
jgi:hypothetical protein